MVTLKNKFSITLVVLIAFQCISFSTLSPNVKLTRLQQDIESIEQIIKHNDLQKTSVFNQIHNLTVQISGNEEIIRIIIMEEGLKNGQLDELRNELAILESEVEDARVLYQKILLEEYKYRDYKTKLVFLVSSKSINEFVNRLHQLERLKVFRMRQLEKLSLRISLLKDKMTIYTGTKLEKSFLVDRKQNARSKLKNLIEERKTALRDIERENNLLQIRLQEAKSAALAFDAQNSEKNIRYKQSVNGENLDWPVESGLIVGKYGVQNHETIYKVKIDNNGVDILVPENSPVRAVKDGKVKSVFRIPGNNSSIIIDHGSFYSVYSNVKNPLVYDNVEVKANTQIATIASNDENLFKLHFEIWEGREKVNPEIYLQPR